MSFAYDDNFTSPFHANLNTFYFFYCLVVVARDFQHHAEKKWWEGASFSCSRFVQKNFAFYHWVSYWPWVWQIVIMFRCIPSISTFVRAFVMNGCWILLCFFCPLERIAWFLSFSFVDVGRGFETGAVTGRLCVYVCILVCVLGSQTLVVACRLIL